MSRRASLPGASELFRPTRPAPEPPPAPAPKQADSPSAVPVPEASVAKKTRTAPKRGDASAEASAAVATGRVRHDHKITVYFSEDELLALEDANLDLRRNHGIRVDRGRIVRVAVAKALADLTERGGESFLVDELGGN